MFVSCSADDMATVKDYAVKHNTKGQFFESKNEFVQTFGGMDNIQVLNDGAYLYLAPPKTLRLDNGVVFGNSIVGYTYRDGMQVTGISINIPMDSPVDPNFAFNDLAIGMFMHELDMCGPLSYTIPRGNGKGDMQVWEIPGTDWVYVMFTDILGYDNDGFWTGIIVGQYERLENGN